MRWIAPWACLVLMIVVSAERAVAQTMSYPDPTLHYIYPAGGQAGQTVEVELGPLSTLNGAREIVVDGPPGIRVRDIKRVGEALGATVTIAADARPGRRQLRVLGGSSGLTNFRYFLVGRLPELREQEPNNTPQTAAEVALPTVINGRLDPNVDIDCFLFKAKAGQRIVASVLAHGIDTLFRLQGGQGFLDTNLELLDEHGKVLAAVEDTLGLDPVIEYTVKTDGRYIVRLQSLGHKGASSAVYRLTLGDVPCPTYVFPAGGQRGTQVEVEFGGPNIAPETRRRIHVPGDGSFPLHNVLLDSGVTDGRELPFLRGDFPEVLEVEPNDDQGHAQPLHVPSTANGRFDKVGDEDWYRVRLKKGHGVLLEVTAQRHLRAPVDTLLQVYDTAGKKLAENDDGPLFARPNHCAHDFSSADSWLSFKAPQDGAYFVRLSEQSGAGGRHAIYRLAVSEAKPDFMIYQWPDAVPIWGAGTTASFVVELYHWGGLKSDVQLRVEGLPSGWNGSTVNVSASVYGTYAPPLGLKVLMTITAPADAALGTVASFRVVGKAEHDGRSLEHEAQYLTLYGNSHNDGMHLRYSPGARAVLAGNLDSWLETSVKEVTGRPGETVQIPVKVHRRPGAKAEIGLVVNGPTTSAGCGMRPPLPLKPDQDEVQIPLTISPQAALGTRGIVVARSWASDLRAGRPGPCTHLILLHVLPGEGPPRSR